MSETAAAEKPSIECIRFGEIIKVLGKDKRLEKHYVMNHCGHEQFPSYYCDSHDAKFANVGALTQHVEECGAESHRLVIYCRKHQWFERVSMAQQEAFKKAGFIS